MRQSDHAVRLAAFRFLEEQVRLSGEEGAIRRSVLERGFVLDGERVPLLGPQGIFKPRVLEWASVTISYALRSVLILSNLVILLLLMRRLQRANGHPSVQR